MFKPVVVVLVIVLSAGRICLAADGDPQQLAQAPRDQQPAGASVVQATGTLMPAEMYDVSAMIPGVVSESLVDYNRKVKKGDVLAKLDAKLYEADLTQARAALQRAEALRQVAKIKAVAADRDYQRAKQLEAAKSIDVAAVELAQDNAEIARANVLMEEASIMQAKAAVERAQLNLDLCVIRSPADGVVIERRCDLGKAVSPGMNFPALFVIASDPKRLEIWADVMEANIAKVAVGQEAEFTVVAFPQQTFKGRVSLVRLNAGRTQSAVRYTVIIDVDNSTGKLLPYMSALVSIAVVAK